MEKLANSGFLYGVIDVTTTEVCDHGGVLSAGAERLSAIARTRVPYVGLVGALDMVNYWAIDTLPAQYAGRNLHRHNPQVTLMRTTAAESRQIGFWTPRSSIVGTARSASRRCARPARPFMIPSPMRRCSRPSSKRFVGHWTDGLTTPRRFDDPEFSNALAQNFLVIAD
jgi:uncharacterized protein (UPF0261 family)